MWHCISSPNYQFWFDFIPNILKHALYSPYRYITVVVSKFTSLLALIWLLPLARSTAWFILTVSVSSYLVQHLEVQVTHKRYLVGFLNFIVWVHLIVELVNKIVTFYFLWFILKQGVHPLLNILLLVFWVSTLLKVVATEEIFLEDLSHYWLNNFTIMIVANYLWTFIHIVTFSLNDNFAQFIENKKESILSNIWCQK